MGGGQMPLLGPGLPPPQNQQLPPQMFTTAAQLLDMTDSKLSLVLTRRVPWRTRLDRDVSLQVSRAGTQKPKMKHRVSTEGFAADDQTLVEKLMVTLRDGRKLIGVLRSWDQFGMCCPHTSRCASCATYTDLLHHPANLVLQSTIERIFVPPTEPSSKTSSPPRPGLYADVPRGIFLVRGENVLLLGEIDLDKDDDPPPGYEKAEIELVHKLAKEKKAKDLRRDKNRLKKLSELGFEGDSTGETLL